MSTAIRVSVTDEAMQGRFPVLHRNTRLREADTDQKRNHAGGCLEFANLYCILRHARPGSDKDFLLPVASDSPHDPETIPAWTLAFRIGFAQHFDGVTFCSESAKTLFSGHIRFDISH